MPPRIDCQYLGLKLNSPVIVGACPLTIAPESLRQMATSGAGAIVLPSLFQEQFAPPHQPALDRESSEFLQTYNGGPDQYLPLLQQAKQASSLPVIASLNGYRAGEWLDFARSIESAGTDALELNIQPTIVSAHQSSAEIETALVELVRQVCSMVSIPVAVKLSRHFTNPANLAERLQQVGAAGLVLFAHEVKWDVAIERLRWTSHWELTPIDSLGPTLAGIIQTRVADLRLSIAASGGIRSAEDAAKAMLAGADAVMIVSEIYRSGPTAIGTIISGLQRHLEAGGFATLADFLAARPTAERRTRHEARFDYLDPLTRSDRYHDPTPQPGLPSGDRYGHKD